MRLIDLAPGHLFEYNSTICIKLDNDNPLGWCEVVNTSSWQHASMYFETEVLDWGAAI